MLSQRVQVLTYTLRWCKSGPCGKVFATLLYWRDVLCFCGRVKWSELGFWIFQKIFRPDVQTGICFGRVISPLIWKGFYTSGRALGDGDVLIWGVLVPRGWEGGLERSGWVFTCSGYVFMLSLGVYWKLEVASNLPILS